MDTAWPYEFRERMHRFEGSRVRRSGEAAISIKVRVSSGCFHREHSPRAYDLIDRSLSRLRAPDTEFLFQEHESGPEILVYVAATTAVLTLAKSVLDLITAVIKARSEGIKKGDHPSDPIDLIVRRVHDVDGFREEKVLSIGSGEAVDETKIEEQLASALRKLLKDDPSPRPSTKRTEPQGQKKQQVKKASRRKSKS